MGNSGDIKALRRDLKAIQANLAEAMDLLNNPFSVILPRPRRERILSLDITAGKETRPIRAINGIDDDPAPTDDFTYITRPILYSSSSTSSRPQRTKSTIGCGCLGDCSDSPKCPCKCSFNEDGRLLVYPKAGILECGPNCKCDPETCKNRVGQNGPGEQGLEIFKTEKTGWGVRSRDTIPDGGFICEYIGEILTDKEAEERIDADEYLFNIGGGFVIDGAKFGNVGRFVNHCCEPNAFAVSVFYCGGQRKMPRIMFFADREIEPLEEIFYDYNYKESPVTPNGVEKVKMCHCGAPCCQGRLY